MTKAQFYKLVNDHCIGDLPLSKSVLIVSAGNEAEHARNTTEDPVPLVLRRANYFIRPLTSEEWLDYANKSGHHEFVTGFIAFRNNLVHSIRYDLPDGVGQPCPRTWSKLSNTLKANGMLSDNDISMLANGFVGQAAACEFMAYVKSAKKVDINSILARPALIKQYEGDDLSLQYAIIQGIVERWRSDKKVLGQAMLVGLEMTRVSMGAHLLRQLKNVDKDKFMASAVDKKIVPNETLTALQGRYLKFLM
jgi:hypothetical protein